jgi:hypothetical protein
MSEKYKSVIEDLREALIFYIEEENRRVNELSWDDIFETTMVSSKIPPPPSPSIKNSK